MEDRFSPNDELGLMFASTVHDVLSRENCAGTDPALEGYLAELLLRFLHTDKIFAIRNGGGDVVRSVTEMVAEGDICTNATSFEQERTVHRHVGDFILFWDGVYPEFLQVMKLKLGADLICDYRSQAKHSYHLVSTYNHKPFDEEAPIFEKLSQDYDIYSQCLRVVRTKIGLA